MKKKHYILGYAKKAERFFDYPCCLYGKIESRYLDKASNNYEAGIRTTNLKYIKDPKIYIFAPTAKDKEYLSQNLKYLLDPNKSIEVKMVSFAEDLLTDFNLALGEYPNAHKAEPPRKKFKV